MDKDPKFEKEKNNIFFLRLFYYFSCAVLIYELEHLVLQNRVLLINKEKQQQQQTRYINVFDYMFSVFLINSKTLRLERETKMDI